MSKVWIFLFFLTVLRFSFGQVDRIPNNLINEKSPYLLKHAYNPVKWNPWSEDILEIASREGKLIIVSIGYASCHWCNVMEEESFEDSTVATFMNDNFICIKVDKEERPDVDNTYMNAAILLNGTGGWPLNAITLPDGRPFFAGTYFTKDKWLKLLKIIVDNKNQNYAKVKNAAEKLEQGLRQQSIIHLVEDVGQIAFSNVEIQQIKDSLLSQIDPVNGGVMGDIKFPKPTLWNSLFTLNQIESLGMQSEILNTLNKMAQGGIYDKLSGGFSRYTVDSDWEIPHFEKMLYDNAQLVDLYLNAFMLTGNSKYQEIAKKTLGFVEGSLSGRKGDFFSSLSADSESEEGTYYVWTASELRDVCGDDFIWFKEFFNIEEEGNWEFGKNVLYNKKSIEEFSKEKGWSISDFQVKLEKVKKRLLRKRSNRISPEIDKKAIASWNAMAANSFLSAYRVLGEKRYLKIAKRNIQFIETQLLNSDGALYRSYLNGASNTEGFSDDYARLITLYISFYQATFEMDWLDKAHKLMSVAIDKFYDEESKMFFFNPKGVKSVITNSIQIKDGVIPSSNSEIAYNLYVLGVYFDKSRFKQMSKQMFDNVKVKVLDSPELYPNWIRVGLLHSKAPFEVAITGKKCFKLRKELNQHFFPNVLLMGQRKKSDLSLLEGKFVKNETLIFVCRDKVCQEPVESIEEMTKQMKSLRGE